MVAFAGVAGAACAADRAVDVAACIEWCDVVRGEALGAVGVGEIVGGAADWAGGVGGLGLSGEAGAGAAIWASAFAAVGAWHVRFRSCGGWSSLGP